MTKLTLTLSQALDRASSAYQAGQLVEAEQICQQIVDTKPDLFAALHLLAVVQSRLGKKNIALASYDRALQVRPNSAEALSNRGTALKELKRFEEALASYDRALTLRPDFAEALFNRGNILHELERFDEALASYDRALEVRPNHAEAHTNRGLTLHELKRFDEALASYDRGLQMRPDDAEGHNNRGNTLRELKRFGQALASYDRALALRPHLVETLSNRGNTLNEALASYDRALALRPDYAAAHINRGLTLHELKRFDEALTSYDRAVQARPDLAEGHINRGRTLNELKRYEEALASFDRALQVRPDDAGALFNRGNALKELERFEEALACYDRALQVRPNYVEAYTNRGLALLELKRFDEALASYDRALQVRPDFAQVHQNEGLLRLLTGDFSRGWGKYEWRWKTEPLALRKRSYSQPLWQGAEALDGKTILLHDEQGFGDQIQFCRYVPLVAARGARVILGVERPLHELMTSLAGVTQVVSEGDPLPKFDLQCPLLSLPLAFATQLETIPSVTPYLHAPVQAVKNWQARLASNIGPRIGLVWSGRPTHRNDRNRSISLRSLLPLLDIEATFVSLQKDVRTDDVAVLKDQSDLLHFGDALQSFSDTAALIANLDLVISVDTSVAHLAGALAKPVWVLLPFVPDWRWLLDRNDSPWYPTALLFRQDDTRQWENVIVHARAALQHYLSQSSD